MSAQDLREFLEDLIQRYDANADISEGSRAQTELIEPVLRRIGIDPIDEELGTFITTRVQQARPDLAISVVDSLTDTVIDPMRILLEPIVREIKLQRLRGSLRNSELMSEDEVDALFANFFQSRRVGKYSRGVVRAYFSAPQTISISQINIASTRGGLRYVPARPQQITAEQMLFNVEGSEYYFDINYIAERQGDEYNVERGEVNTIGGLPSATRISNLRRFRDGAPRENTAEYEARVGASISDKTLTVARGVLRTLTDAFGGLRHLYVIGYRDPEMKRDVIRGGGLGPVPDPDSLGLFYGLGQPVDDNDGDTTTPIFEAATGSFVARLAAAGQDPQTWYLSLVYTDAGPTLRVQDVRITEVLSNTQVRLEEELPVALAAGSVTWSLRERKITLSGIPGGIVFPSTAEGDLEIRDDEIHVGGRTDIYVAGSTDAETSQISGLSDETPLFRGSSAITNATDTVELPDVVFDPSRVVPGMSLVLEEGADAGSYRILAVNTAPNGVRLEQVMTGSQPNLSWRIVDEIDVELTDPKEIKGEGADVVTVASNAIVVTLGAFNFRDANVLEGDILELRGDPALEGDYTIEEVTATSIEVSPAPTRTVSGVAWRIFRRSEALDVPVVRVSRVELVDSAGAPVGTEIPYRDPVLAVSRGFGNEGAGLLFDERVITGFVLGGIRPALGETYGAGNYFWGTYDPEALWRGPIGGVQHLFNLAAPATAAALAGLINADPDFVANDIMATVLSDRGYDFVALLTGDKFVRLGPSSTGWGIGNGYSSASVRAFPGVRSLLALGVRAGDLVEIYQGSNAVLQTRAVVGPFEEPLAEHVVVGLGPIGPRTSVPSGGQHPRIAGLYSNHRLNPDINGRARVARASVGSARTYFLSPTSAEFDALTTRYETESGLQYRPDPENTRVLSPPPPESELVATGQITFGAQFQDPTRNFLLLGIKPGDLLDVLYRPIIGTSPLPGAGNLALTGLVLRIRLRGAPYINVSFPADMPRQEALDYINEQVGEDVADLTSTDALRLKCRDGLLELDDDIAASTVLDPGNGDPLFLVGAVRSTEHPQTGTYIIRSLPSDTSFEMSEMTLFQTLPSEPYPQTEVQYRIRRYIQRVSSTEMRDNQDITGLYYADVELLATAPGDQYNIPSDITLEVSGHRADGFRLYAESDILTFSRAERLWAEFSRTILLPGSSDSPEEYVQLSRQNIQVSYDRSSLVDEIQSFVDSDGERVVVQDILVRHLRPHYLRLNWTYAGGPSEPVMVRAVTETLDKIVPGDELEVGNIVDVLRKRGADKVYSLDPDSARGRNAPVIIALFHDVDRSIRGLLIRDAAQAGRLARWIPDSIVLRRLSASGLR